MMKVFLKSLPDLCALLSANIRVGLGQSVVYSQYKNWLCVAHTRTRRGTETNTKECTFGYQGLSSHLEEKNGKVFGILNQLKKNWVNLMMCMHATKCF